MEVELYEIWALGAGLAMDAFAVAVCKGLSIKKATLKNAVTVGAWFGGFQGVMPLLGFLMGFTVAEYLDPFDGWIAFLLLGFIGASMIKEGISPQEGEADGSLKFIPMLTVAVATSIDALAVGVTFAFKKVNVIFACSVIAAVTFVLSAAGVKVGSSFGNRYRWASQLAGGFILIFLGIKAALAG